MVRFTISSNACCMSPSSLCASSVALKLRNPSELPLEKRHLHSHGSICLSGCCQTIRHPIPAANKTCLESWTSSALKAFSALGRTAIALAPRPFVSFSTSSDISSTRLRLITTASRLMRWIIVLTVCYHGLKLRIVEEAMFVVFLFSHCRSAAVLHVNVL